MAKNTTKVPDGPLIKKKGVYAGSTLKKGGVIKKAQNGISKKGSKDIVETKIGNQTYVTTAPKNKGPKFVTNPMGASKDTSKYQLPRGIMNLVNEASKGYKAGGTIKKAQAGVKLTPQQKRAQLDSIASVRRADIIRKKDSILNRNAAARGMTREEVRARQKRDKGKQVDIYNGQSNASEKPDVRGSCTKGDYYSRRNGGMIKRADGSMSKRGLWDNIRANKGSGKKPTKQMLVQEKKIKAKSKK